MTGEECISGLVVSCEIAFVEGGKAHRSVMHPGTSSVVGYCTAWYCCSSLRIASYREADGIGDEEAWDGDPWVSNGRDGTRASVDADEGVGVVFDEDALSLIDEKGHMLASRFSGGQEILNLSRQKDSNQSN